MSKIIEEAKAIFLVDVDEETYQENLEKIQAWEAELIHNEALIEWQRQDMSKNIINKAKEAYINVSLLLMNKRDLSEQDRSSLFAQQDACKFILGLLAENKDEEIKQLNLEIRRKISAISG